MQMNFNEIELNSFINILVVQMTLKRGANDLISLYKAIYKKKLNYNQKY